VRLPEREVASGSESAPVDAAPVPSERGQPAGRHRILFVIKNLQQGGTERQVMRLVGSLDPARFECRLCTLTADGEGIEPIEGVDRVLVGAGGGRGAAVDQIARVIDEYRPDLVHSYRDRVNLLVRRALARTRHQPVLLVSVRGRPVSPLYLAFGRFIARRAYRFTVNSRAIADSLVRFCGLPRQQVVTIENLADVGAFTPASTEEKLAARRALGLPAREFIWVLPARISHVKNQLGLVWAMAYARRAGWLGDDVRLVLVGRSRDRFPSWALPRWIRHLGLEKHVELRPAMAQPLPLYQAADALVLPSWAEGMPNVVIEAQLCGLPVVVSRQANRDDIIRHEETGLVVPTGRRRALALAMAHLCSLPAPFRRTMGMRGRAAMIERFGARVNAERFQDLYLEALVAAGPGRPEPQPR
jgi:glycosyltransferase involved in cell wall biosynthesis